MAPAPTFYDILGVSRSASTDEIKKAYRKLAFDLHPDRHVGASAEEVERLTVRMSEASEAYEVLSDQSLRAEYDARLRLGFSDHQSAGTSNLPRQPGPGECMFCGHGPATLIELHQGIGLIITRRKGVVRINACKGCAKAMFRQVQNDTLIKGWWGIIAFFANIGYVLHNLGTLSTISSMAEPRPPLEPLLVPLAHPMPPGRPLLRRAGVWISVIAFVIAGAIIAGHNANSSNSAASSSSASTASGTSGSSGSSGASGATTQLSFTTGSCITASGNSITGVTGCDNSHYAKIVGVTGTSGQCPASTTNTYTEQSGDANPGKVVCFDNTQ